MALGPQDLLVLTDDDRMAIQNIEKVIDCQLQKTDGQYNTTVYITPTVWDSNLHIRSSIRRKVISDLYCCAGW
jgi:hypothetical protein